MRIAKIIILVLVTCLQMAVSAHCQIEAITDLDFLRCEPEAHGQSSTSDCADQTCCAAENAQFVSQHVPFSLPPRDLLTAPLVIQFAELELLDSQAQETIETAAPPEQLQTRHFYYRTALPVRAPSSLC